MQCNILIKRKWQSIQGTESDYEDSMEVRMRAMIIGWLTLKEDEEFQLIFVTSLD